MKKVLQDEHIRWAAEQLFAEAELLSDLTRKRVLELAEGKVGKRAFARVFPDNQFALLRQTWLRHRIVAAMDAVFSEAQQTRDVSIQQVARKAGCSARTVMIVAGSEWDARLATLADPAAVQERLLQAIERLVTARIPLSEYTWARIYAEAGIRRSQANAQLRQAFRKGYEALVHSREQQRKLRIPGATYACIQGDWINVDESTWYLSAVGETLQRDRLRPDIAAIAWPLLREEALSTSPSAHTLYTHYQSCLFVAKILGSTIPDIGTLTLEKLQHAWLVTTASKKRQKQGKTMLTRMLEALLAPKTALAPLQTQEYARALHWLEALSLKEPSSTKAFLSEVEFDAVLDGCLEDITQGVSFAQLEDAADHIAPCGQCAQEVEAVLHWGIALIILIMAFTGLRRQSIARLVVSDLAQLGPHAFALTWRHGKPMKERIAIIPALVAEHIQYYIRATAPIRDHLRTQHIFLARNRIFRWDHLTPIRVGQVLETFVRRHGLESGDAPLQLGSTLLRRTYVTRALYTFPSVAALQAQLGHNDSRTTLLYVQHDRYTHPAHVEHALDAFGRKVLVRWQKPLLLEELPDAERQRLLGAQEAHSQEVGLCRHDCCAKLDEERLPPCSLCEHLVSGPEYLVAWEQEKVFREQQLEHLAKTPGAELFFAQMKGQYDRFLANYHFLQKEKRA